MKLNLRSQNNMSSFDLKQQFIGLLSNEFDVCGFDVVLGFESSFKERICTLKFVDGKQIEICVNLDYVKKSVNDIGCSLMFKVRYCALFVADYIKQIERAKINIPQSYFEGLVFLNAIDTYKEKKTVSVYSPLFFWGKKPKQTYCIRPIEISCAVNSLNRLRFLAPTGLNKQDKQAIEACSDDLLLYTGSPEISYIRAKNPVYSIVDSFKKLKGIIAKDPKVVNEFPVLTLVPFEQIEQLTTRSLFLYCVQSNNKFLLGFAIRIIAFLQLSHELELEDSVHVKLIDAMNHYIDYSLIYYQELSESGGYLLKDNFYAIRTAIKSINNYLAMHGISAVSGNIHSID